MPVCWLQASAKLLQVVVASVILAILLFLWKNSVSLTSGAGKGRGLQRPFSPSSSLWSDCLSRTIFERWGAPVWDNAGEGDPRVSHAYQCFQSSLSDPYYENQCRTRLPDKQPKLTEQPKPLHLKTGGIFMDQQCFPPKDADCSPPSPFRSCSASLVELWLSGTCPGDTHARKRFLKPTQILSLHHGV